MSEAGQNGIERGAKDERVASPGPPATAIGEPAPEPETSRLWRPYRLLATIVACAVVGAAAVALRWGIPGKGVGSAGAASMEASAPSVAALMGGSAPDAHRDAFDPFPSQAGTTGAGSVESTSGPEALTGPEGPAGADGAEGVAGPGGPEGSVGTTGPAGIGLTALETPAGGMAIVSPDGTSYRLFVTNDGVILQGPTTTQVWNDSSHFQTASPEPKP